jgi:hypothetical protein
VAFSLSPPPSEAVVCVTDKKEKIILKKRTIPSSISRLCLIDKEMIYCHVGAFFLFIFIFYLLG